MTTDAADAASRRPELLRPPMPASSNATARRIEYILIPGAALVGALALFGIFVALFGKNPLDLYFYMYQGAFGTWFSWQNTLTRAAPLILTALCTALPAQLGLVDHRRRRRAGDRRRCRRPSVALALPWRAAAGRADSRWSCAGVIGGGLWIALAGALRQYRGVNETISSLLLVYIAHRAPQPSGRGPAARSRPASTSRRPARSATPT